MNETGKDQEEQRKTEDLPDENKVYTYLGSVPVDDEFIDNLGRGGSR